MIQSLPEIIQDVETESIKMNYWVRIVLLNDDSFFCLTQVPVLALYRNESIDLHSKSIDWVLYGSNTGT